MDGPPERNLLDRLRLRPAIRWWALEQQGDLFAVAHKSSQPEDQIGDKRGTVKGFSRASRLRMLKTIARIDWRKNRKALFVTLTYPDDYWSKDFGKRTQQRSQFVRDLENHVGRKLGILWRVEWKPRLSGPRLDTLAPHQHFVIFGAPWIQMEWFNARWRGILGYDGHVQTDVEVLRGAEAAAQYAAKYAAKDSLGGLDNDAYLNTTCGRSWGVLRRLLVPWRPNRYLVSIPPEAVVMAQDFAAEITGKRYPGGFVLLHCEAERLFTKLVDTLRLGA